MINVKIDRNGQSFVKMTGNGIRSMTSEAFLVIESIYQAFYEHDPEDADSFKMAFYRAANDRKFFNWSEEDAPVKAEREETPEQKLRRSLMNDGVPEETADELIKVVQRLGETIAKMTEDCDD